VHSIIPRRRAVVAAVSAIGASAFTPSIALIPRASFAQVSAKIFRIGMLHPANEATVRARGALDALRAGLSDLSWVEGKNILFDFRFGDNDPARLAGLAAELVAEKPDVLIAVAPASVAALSAATKATSIPVVVHSSTDLVAAGVATSLRHPGGNFTGSTFFYEEIMVKRLEALKEAQPRLTQAAVLLVSTPENAAFLRVMYAAAKTLKLRLHSFEIANRAEIESTFTAIAKQRITGLVVSDHPMFIANAKLLADLALEKRLVSIGFSSFAAQGGMLDYGVDFFVLWRRVGYFIDKIFKGAKAGEIPIEQPTRFDFTVNLKTAQALGIKLPGATMIRATKVIE
jgi:putative ABC transport system substrate-binding protein